MKEVWVNKQTVLSAPDERGLERRLYSLESALRRRDGSIVEVKRSASEVRDRHVAVIRYELLLLLAALGRCPVRGGGTLHSSRGPT
jgi:hypothetical protein